MYKLDYRCCKILLNFSLPQKLQNNFALCILNGHNAMVSGSFKNAVGEYVRGFRQRVDDPFVNMMIGVSIAHMACQRYTIKRNSLFVQVGTHLLLCVICTFIIRHTKIGLF